MNNKDQIQALFEKLLASEISAAERMSLQKLIQASEENKEYYMDLCQVHAMLAEEHGAFATGLGTVIQPPQNSKKKSKPILNFVLSLAAIIAISFVLIKLPSRNGADNQLNGQGQAVAILTHSIGAKFSGALSELKKDDVLREGLYGLERGIVEIAYDNGTKIVVESPANFELFSNNSISLSDGKLSANVTPAGKGFTVHALGVSIVDLGTEFSVSVKPGKYLDAHVFKGLVDVEMNYETEQISHQLKEGSAARVMVGSQGPVLAGIDLRDDVFIRNIKEPQNDYSELILSKNPVAYYPMNINPQGRTLDDWSKFKNNGHTAGVKEQATLWAAGKIGSAIQLSGSNRKAYVYVDDYPKAESNHLSVVGWVYAESRPMWATIVKNWGLKLKGQFHFGLNPAGLLDIEVLPKTGESIHITENMSFPIRSWQHVAFVHDGKKVKVFRNGRVVASGDVDGLYYPVELQKMSIGTKLDDYEAIPANTPGFWDGRLDEIAIFNHALTDDEIKQLYDISK